MRCPETVLSDLSIPAVPANFSNELLRIPTADFPAATVDGAQEKAEDKTAAGSPDDAADPDTLEWEFEAGKQLAVMTLNAPLSAIRQMGTDCGASMLLHTGRRDNAAGASLIQVTATQRKKRKRGEEGTAEARQT
eukprot:COSAG02_NODE_115_length_35467_cov_292.837056_2_plen_135_part_00